MRLAAENTPVLFSEIVRLEFTHAIKNLGRKAQLPGSLREQFQLDVWNTNHFVRERWLQFGVQEFERFLATFSEVIEIPYRRHIWRDSVRIMAFHDLDQLDAIHVASAQRLRARAFATCDRKLGRLKGAAPLEVILIPDDAPDD